MVAASAQQNTWHIHYFIWQANIYKTKITQNSNPGVHNTLESLLNHAINKKRQKAFLVQILVMTPVMQIKAGLSAIKTQRSASVVTFLHASCIMLLYSVECVCSAHVV